jgi:hypothetical protein
MAPSTFVLEEGQIDLLRAALRLSSPPSKAFSIAEGRILTVLLGTRDEVGDQRVFENFMYSLTTENHSHILGWVDIDGILESLPVSKKDLPYGLHHFELVEEKAFEYPIKPDETLRVPDCVNHGNRAVRYLQVGQLSPRSHIHPFNNCDFQLALAAAVGETVPTAPASKLNYRITSLSMKGYTARGMAVLDTRCLDGSPGQRGCEWNKYIEGFHFVRFDIIQSRNVPPFLFGTTLELGTPRLPSMVLGHQRRETAFVPVAVSPCKQWQGWYYMLLGSCHAYMPINNCQCHMRR